MSDLPPGWEWATLGDVSQVSGGIQKQAKRRPVLNKYPFLRVANVSGGVMNLSEVHEVELFEGEIEKYRLRAGDLLIIEGNGSLNKLGLATIWRDQIPNCVHQNHLIRVRPYRGIEPAYLLHVWNSPPVRDQIERLGASTSGLHTLSVSKILPIRLPIPPLNEQRRIVAALEDHLSRLDVGVTAVRRAQQRIAVAMRSQLHTLFGDLGPQRPLGSILREPLRNGYSGRSSKDGDGARTLTLTAVTKGEFIDDYTKIATVDGRNIDDLWLKPGDILVQRSNTPELVGTSAVYKGEHNWAIFPDLLIRVRTNHEVLPDFAQMALSSPKVHQTLRESAKGLAGSMPKIDQGTLERVLIPVPPLADQERIVDRVYEFHSHASRLAAELVSAQARGDRLRQSLLVDSFNGRLVSQEPVDEPASVLMEHVRAERAAAELKPKRTRRAKNTDQETLL